MSKQKEVKIRVLTSLKMYAIADSKDESKVVDIIRNRVLPKTKEVYYAVDVKIKRKINQTPEYLIAYLLRKDIYLTEVVRVDLESDYTVSDITWNYDSSQAEDEEEEETESAKAEKYAGFDFVVSTPFDTVPTAKVAVQDLQNLITGLGYNSKMLLGADASLANYKQLLTSGLKGFVNIGHGNTSGISLSDGFLDASWFNSVSNNTVNPAVVYFNSCQTFNEPLKSAIMKSGARTFIGGIVNLLIGPSEKVCVCFWTNSLKTAKLSGMGANLTQCEANSYPSSGAHGITGDNGRFIMRKIAKEVISDTIKEVRKDPIRDTIKEVHKDPIKDTIKEVRKDPVSDVIKQVGRDTIQPSEVIRPRGNIGYVSPFITETPSRAARGIEDQIAQATAYVQELENALRQIEQQTAELLAAYEDAVATLGELNQGQI